MEPYGSPEQFTSSGPVSSIMGGNSVKSRGLKLSVIIEHEGWQIRKYYHSQLVVVRPFISVKEPVAELPAWITVA